MTPRGTRLAVAILIVINVGSASALTHLLFFAGKGARYTAMDGAQERSERVLADLELQRQQEAERQERITSDLALAARVDLLHNLLDERQENSGSCLNTLPE